jgi:hypothetical protein
MGKKAQDGAGKKLRWILNFTQWFQAILTLGIPIEPELRLEIVATGVSGRFVPNKGWGGRKIITGDP